MDNIEELKKELSEQYVSLLQVKKNKKIKCALQITAAVLNRLIKPLEVGGMTFYRKEDVKLLIDKLDKKDIHVLWKKNVIFYKKDDDTLIY